MLIRFIVYIRKYHSLVGYTEVYMTAGIYDLIAYSESSTNETLSKSISKVKEGERDWRMILEFFQKLFSSFKISLETFWEFDEFTPTEGGCGRQQDFLYLLFHNDTQ